MTLSELLSLLRGSILNDRTDRISGGSDYLWTDETLVTYINEAQRLLAVRGLVLRDGSTDEVTKITLVAGQSQYPLHEAVLAVITAKNETDTYDLKRAGHQFLNAYRAPTDSWVEPSTYASATGKPLVFTTDEDLSEDDNGGLSAVTLRVYPTPDASVAGTVVRLRVVRKPLEKLRLSSPSQVPEVPEDHHLEMLDWAAYLALRIVDDDAGSARRAIEFKTFFEQNVTEARKSAMRKLFAPMGWGFGRGGFSWER